MPTIEEALAQLARSVDRLADVVQAACAAREPAAQREVLPGFADALSGAQERSERDPATDYHTPEGEMSKGTLRGFVLGWVLECGCATTREVYEHFEISQDEARAHLHALVDAGQLEAVGSGRWRKYCGPTAAQSEPDEEEEDQDRTGDPEYPRPPQGRAKQGARFESPLRPQGVELRQKILNLIEVKPRTESWFSTTLVINIHEIRSHLAILEREGWIQRCGDEFERTRKAA